MLSGTVRKFRRMKENQTVSVAPFNNGVASYCSFWNSSEKHRSGKDNVNKTITHFLSAKRSYSSNNINNKMSNSSSYYLIFFIILLIMFFLMRKRKDKITKKVIIINHLHEALKLIQEGKINKAIAPLVKAGEYYPEIHTLINLIENENFESAIMLAEDIFVGQLELKDPYDLLKAIFLACLNKEVDALALLDIILKRSENAEFKAYCHFHKSVILNQQGNYAKAGDEMKNAIALSDIVCQFPKNYSAVNALLKQYVKENQQNWLNNKINFVKDKKKRVVIRVWKKGEGSKYGHAALETDKNYISFWPDRNKDENGTCGSRHNTFNR